ncbi:hypothetical protein CB1_000137001 [Camelus ferus]|nr:hypothetical protein CB1_000137001 [Camelus ferus]
MLGAATFVMPCGREHESGAVETRASQTQLEVSMAEREPTAEQLAQTAAVNDEDEHSVNYKPPAQKSIQEVQELDQDSERLRNVPDVVVTRRTLVCSTAPGPLELDLAGDLESFKKQSFVLKEGVEYRIKIAFRVNREVMSGMKYIQHTYGKGGGIDETAYVVGSYGPGRRSSPTVLTCPKALAFSRSQGVQVPWAFVVALTPDLSPHLGGRVYHGGLCAGVVLSFHFSRGQCLEPPDPPESPQRIQPAAEPYSSYLGLPAWSRVPGLAVFIASVCAVLWARRPAASAPGSVPPSPAGPPRTQTGQLWDQACTAGAIPAPPLLSLPRSGLGLEHTGACPCFSFSDREIKSP